VVNAIILHTSCPVGDTKTGQGGLGLKTHPPIDRSCMNNPYYNPTEMGLEIVCELSEDLSYEFNQLVLWKEISTNVLYWAHDSGCSCPTPFEDYANVKDLTPVKKETLYVLEQEVENFPCNSSEKHEFLRLAKRYLRTK
jgi:hypothetical protein